jgi:Flp pilus assembly protein TadB
MKYSIILAAALVAAPAFGQTYLRQDSTEYANQVMAENARRQAEFYQREYQQRQLEIQRDMLHEMERQRREREWERSREQQYYRQQWVR